MTLEVTLKSIYTSCNPFQLHQLRDSVLSMIQLGTKGFVTYSTVNIKSDFWLLAISTKMPVTGRGSP